MGMGCLLFTLRYRQSESVSAVATAPVLPPEAGGPREDFASVRNVSFNQSWRLPIAEPMAKPKPTTIATHSSARAKPFIICVNI